MNKEDFSYQIVEFIKNEPEDPTESNSDESFLNEDVIDAVDYDVVSYLNVKLETTSDDEEICHSDDRPVRCLHHNIEKCRQCRLNAPFICKICKRGYCTFRSLYVHSKQHAKNFTNEPTCKICNKTFDSRRIMRHFKEHHVRKPFPCYFCDRSFFTKSHLDEHIRGHTGEKEFACNLCSAAFEKEADLKKHYKTHAEECLYACSICDHKFSSLQNLSRHINDHKKRKKVDAK